MGPLLQSKKRSPPRMMASSKFVVREAGVAGAVVAAVVAISEDVEEVAVGATVFVADVEEDQKAVVDREVARARSDDRVWLD